MGAVSARREPNRDHPITDKSPILAGGDMGSVVETAREHKPAREHLGRFDPGQHSLTRVFRQLELDWSLGFALDNGNAFSHAIIFDQVRHGQFDQIAAAQLTIYGDVEQSQIA